MCIVSEILNLNHLLLYDIIIFFDYFEILDFFFIKKNILKIGNIIWKFIKINIINIFLYY